MSDYHRVTSECSLDNMNPLLANVIRDHVEQYEIVDIFDSILIGCETTSIKETKKLFRHKITTDIVGLILTPKWLIRAGSQDGELTGVFSGRLTSLRIEDYEKTTMYDLVSDTGIMVSGFHMMSEGATIFLGFGQELAAQKFRNMLRETMATS